MQLKVSFGDTYDQMRKIDHKSNIPLYVIVGFMLGWVIVVNSMAVAKNDTALVIANFIYSFPILFFSYLWDKTPRALGKLYLTLAALWPWAYLLPISEKTVVSVAVVFFYALLIYAVCIYLLKREKHIVIYGALLFMFISLFVSDFAVGVICYPFSDPDFGYVTLSIEILITAMVFVVAIKSKKRLATCIAIVLVTFSLAMAVVENTARILNYALDTSDVKPEIVQVEEKEKITRRKRSTKYLIHGTLDGREIELDVPERIYNDCEKGDNLPIEICEGAFDKAYIKVKE